MFAFIFERLTIPEILLPRLILLKNLVHFVMSFYFLLTKTQTVLPSHVRASSRVRKAHTKDKNDKCNNTIPNSC